MAQIMCTKRLWTALNHARRLPVDVSRPVARNGLLGDWAATIARLKHHDLVLALDARTWLTLVFPLSPRLHFRANFVAALEQALEDHRVISRDAAVRECAEIEMARIEHLSNAELRSALEAVEFICGVEMDYHQDLRSVQWNLNQFPHRKEEPCVPSEALLALLGPPGIDASRGASPECPGRGIRGRPARP